MRKHLISRLLWGLLLVVGPSAFAQEPSVFYPARYHPDAADRTGAVAVVLQPGETSPTLLFRLIQSGGTAQARILSEQTGEGIAGLLVEACVGRFRAFARTGPDGSVTIPGVPAGLVTLRTRPDDVRSETGAYAVRYAPGVADSTGALHRDLSDGERVDFGTFSIPEGARIKATVVDPSGAPWESIPIVLRAEDPAQRRVHRSDPQGRVTFGGLEPGSYRLWADTRGTIAVSEAWDGSRDTLASTPLAVSRGDLLDGIVISPDRGGRIIGAVRHRNTNVGLPGLEVQVFPATDPTAVFSVTTDPLGFYQAAGLPSGSYKVYVPAIRRYFPEEETLQQARSVAVTEPNVTNGIDVRGLPVPDCTIAEGAAAVIEGIVQGDFNLVPSARIVVWSDTDTASITITEAGLYRHDCLVSGAYRAAILPDGFYRTQYHPKVSDPDSAALVMVSSGDTARAVDFEPERGVVLQGSVLAAGAQAPIEGVPVIAECEDPALTVRTVTAIDGGFQLDRLPDATALPSGAWIVRTDSLTVVRIDATPVLRIGLSAEPTSNGLLLALELPEAGLVDWWIDRTAGGSPPERVAEARDHPDGLHATAWVDPSPPPGARYRLIAHLSGAGGIDVAESDWIPAPALPPPLGELFPQPWTGREELVLPAAPASGAIVTVHAIDGRRVRQFQIAEDRIAPDRLAALVSGVYFVSWRDAHGDRWVRRLVVRR